MPEEYGAFKGGGLQWGLGLAAEDMMLAAFSDGVKK